MYQEVYSMPSFCPVCGEEQLIPWTFVIIRTVDTALALCSVLDYRCENGHVFLCPYSAGNA
jgi:hypothetical protein